MLVEAFMLTNNRYPKWKELALHDALSLGLAVKEYEGYVGSKQHAQGRAKGLKEASAKYVTWIDDDDRYPDTGALSDLIELLEDNPCCPFAYSSEQDIDEKDNIISEPKQASDFSFNTFRLKPSFIHGLILIRRAFITEDMLKDVAKALFPEHMLLAHLYKKHGMPLKTSKVGRLWRKHEQQLHSIIETIGHNHRPQVKDVFKEERK